ncbi:Dual specificity protein phosphatase [Fragilaria crotonensis]|nr:Dual specificity protein phosphatase [Fragilaria crotonensis]
MAFFSCGAESFLGGGRSPIRSTTSIAASQSVAANEDDPLQAAVEVLKDRLYHIALKEPPNQNKLQLRRGKPLHYFQIDTELIYWNFFLDFGPLNLGQLYRFSKKVNMLLDQKKDHTIVFYCSTDPKKRANAKYLISAWQMLYLDRTPEQALYGFVPRDDTFSSSSTSATIATPSRRPTAPPSPESTWTTIPTTSPTLLNSSSAPQSPTAPTILSVPPFHDASPCACSFQLTVLDCLRGLAKARQCGFFDFTNFDVAEYEHFEQVENGDLNWIIKDRIIAFAGPHYRRTVSRDGHCAMAPSDYIPYFKRVNVDLVVRLNKKCYNEDDFTKVGIRHFDQYYLDGSCPPMDVLDRIVLAFETVPANKAFAVHCKAGLGRTGTCIGAYMMKHYKFTAAEAIGWMRICRPGMVIGPQQQFLKDIEQRMWHEGDAMKLEPTKDARLLRINKSDNGSPKSVIALPQQYVDDDERKIGREGQAEGLLARRNLLRK